MALALDLTGALLANKVNNESRDVSLQVNRYLVPNKGAFYAKDLVIRNLANNQILQPITDYSLYEPVTDLWKQLGVGVYKIIHISNPLIAAVSITYQAVGGQYQYTTQNLSNELNALLAGGDGTYPFGHVVGQPIGGLPPELHLEDGQQIYDAGKVVLALNQMRDVLMNGDRLALGHVYQYINDVTTDAYTRAIDNINAVKNRLDELMSTLDEGIGDLIITDNPTNPSVRKGYGQFQLNPDVLLIGANDVAEVGQLVGLKEGTDLYARRTFIWSQVENLGQVTYSMAASATAIDEGEAVTFTLTTTGLSAGTRVPYRITGGSNFTSADITQSLLGNFIIGSDGIATVTINAVNDLATEGNESFTLAITPVSNVSRTVTIRDTSRSPTINVKYSANVNGTGTVTQCNEGDTVYLYITGANLPPGHNFNIVYSGSAQGSDFDAARVLNFTLDPDGTKAIPFTLVNDGITDGDRTMIASVSSSVVTTAVSAALLIKDTSKIAEYRMWFASDVNGANVITNVNEGDVFYLIGKFTNVTPNKKFGLILGGTAGQPHGSLALVDYMFFGNIPPEGGAESLPSGASYFHSLHSSTNGVDLLMQKTGLTPPDGAFLKFQALTDFKSEGAEVISAKLVEYVAPEDATDSLPTLASASLTINDTSQDAAYDVGFYNNADGTGSKLTQCNEGQTVFFVLKTANLQPSERTLSLAYASTVNAADFTTTLPSSITIPASNVAAFAVTVKNDSLTEGTEELRVTVSRSSVQLAVGAINIMDTSVAPTIQAMWSKTPSTIDATSSINEGETAYFIVQATNVPPNSIMNISLIQSGTWAGANDIVGTLPTQLTLNSSGSGYLTVTFKNDMTVEGIEQFTLNAYIDIASVRYQDQASLTVNDTSTPSATFVFSRNYGTSTSAITNINEDEDFYLVGSYNGYTLGDVFNLTFEGANTWQTAPASTCSITNQTGSIGNSQTLMRFAANLTVDGARNLTAKVFKNGVQVGTAVITVNDTSVAPPPTPTFEFVTSANLYPAELQSVTTFMNNRVVTPDILDTWDNHVDLFLAQYITIAVKTTNVPAGTSLSFSAAVIGGLSTVAQGVCQVAAGTTTMVTSNAANTGGANEIRPLNTGAGIGKVNANGWAAFLFYSDWSTTLPNIVCVPRKDCQTCTVHFNASTLTNAPVLSDIDDVGSKGFKYRMHYSTSGFVTLPPQTIAGDWGSNMLLSGPLTNNVRDEMYRYIFMGVGHNTTFCALDLVSAGGAGASGFHNPTSEPGAVRLLVTKYDKYGAYKNTLPKRTNQIWDRESEDVAAPMTTAIYAMLAADNGTRANDPPYNGNGGDGSIDNFFMSQLPNGDYKVFEDDCVVVSLKVLTRELGKIGVTTTTSAATGPSLTGTYNNAGKGGNNFSSVSGELGFIDAPYGGTGGSGMHLVAQFNVSRKHAAEKLYLPPLIFTFNNYTDIPGYTSTLVNCSSIMGGQNAASGVGSNVQGTNGRLAITGWGSSGAWAD